MNPKILLVDDHEIVREGVRNLLGRMRPGWDICGEAASGSAGVLAATALQPDLVVLDITMPGGSGLDAAAQITRKGLGCRILMFTMHEAAGLEDEIRKCGAHGYVVKSRAVRDLVYAIDQLLAGGTFFRHEPESSLQGKHSDKKGISSCGSLLLQSKPSLA